MKARKYIIERIIVEDATSEEIESLFDKEFTREGDTYFGEPIYE